MKNCLSWLYSAVQKLKIFFSRSIDLQDAVISGDIKYVELFFSQYNTIINLQDENNNNYTALHYAVIYNQTEIIKIILEYNPNINLQDHNGNTALHYAAAYSYTSIAELLLKYDPDCINLLNEDNWTALHYAAAHGNIGSIKLLLKYNSEISNLQDIWGNTALHYAAECGNTKIIKLLLKHNPGVINLLDEDNRTALHYAAAHGNIGSIKLLLKYNSEISNLQDIWRNTALHYAAACGYTSIAELLLKYDPDCINLLDEDNWTALHYAAAHGNIDSIKLLLKYNSKISNLQDIWGKTALYYAATRCHIESAKLLLNHNLEIELQNYLYNELNTYEKEVVELFITHAVKLRHFSKDINSKIVTRNTDFIQNSPNLNELAQRCEQEIQKMKNIKIGSSDKTIHSMYLLPNNTNVLARYANNLEVLDWYENSKQEFPLYGPEVARTIENGTNRKKLLEGVCKEKISIILNQQYHIVPNNPLSKTQYSETLDEELHKSITFSQLNNYDTHKIYEYLDNPVLKELQHEYKTIDVNDKKCFFCSLSGEEVVNIET
ncbi:ankyrin repeat-containing protein 09 [Orientia tsutsugamushi]|uniref:Ankyrin repeat-containing protein 09 n=1 Tax=Orientia tsutsugamushi TaxID=784 RepID=A0A2R8F309_ORITS|nr:ankyrin repeat domain-containing protein [Orientia tsutsugamushi]SPM45501.1 ankyrin repeat-containing protein 09 [Orientia tsutsugamushi]SPM45689.1 ankyrin repeat-containing protein 09 [Orientia tsutsugamushi]